MMFLSGALFDLLVDLFGLLAKVDGAGIGRRLARVPVGLWIFALVTLVLVGYTFAAGGAVIYLAVAEKPIPGILDTTLSGSVGYLGGVAAATIPVHKPPPPETSL
jgi:hypothetical protein